MSKTLSSFPRKAEGVLRSVLDRTSGTIDDLKVAVQPTRRFQAVLKEVLHCLSQQMPFHARPLMGKRDSFVRRQCKFRPHSLGDGNKVPEQIEVK